MSSYPISDDERNRLLSHSRITVALALAAADAKNEEQTKGVALALWRIAGEMTNASWGFDSKAFVAEVERMAQAEIDRQKSMASLGRTLSKAMVADAEAAKGGPRMNTREAIDAAAAEHGWELLKDHGYFVQFGRGEHERLTVRFSDNDAEKGRRLIAVYNQYPTGDRTALDGRVCFAARHLGTHDKGKREAALAWLAEVHYAKPGTNKILASFNYSPVLNEAPEAPFDAEAFRAEVKATGWAGPLDGRRGTV